MTAPVTRLRRGLTAVRRRHTLLVPLALAATLTASASGYSLITVHRGDTVSGLALRYHTTVSRLIALNHLPGDGDVIYAGQTLRVPGQGSSSGGSSSSGSGDVTYTVRRGDTLDGIAARYHVAPTAIARRNHLPSSLMVRIGQRLVIGHARASHTSAPPTGGIGNAAARHDRAVLADHAEPSQDEVASMIRSTAAQWRLDPRLALAISYQESGFNMRVVSGVDAVGAMQIMPYTGTYLSDNVVHRRLDLDDAQDNITAGVALLSLLQSETHNERRTAAGYYQGLQSVRDHGMLRDTKQYVRDVLALRQRF